MKTWVHTKTCTQAALFVIAKQWAAAVAATAHIARPRGATPRPRSGAAAESARLPLRRNSREELPKSEVRGGGQEELPHAPNPRPGAAAGRTNPTSKEQWLRGRRRA